MNLMTGTVCDYNSGLYEICSRLDKKMNNNKRI